MFRFRHSQESRREKRQIEFSIDYGMAVLILVILACIAGRRACWERFAVAGSRPLEPEIPS